MLSTLASAPVSLLSLGIRQHGMLLSGQAKEVHACLQAADWTCHICGVRVPEMMEIDHTGGHARSAVKGFKAICQFCHNLKHPLWAAARGRIVPIIAPGVGQLDLHRLAWTLLAQRGAKAPAVDVTGILADLEERQKLFVTTYGGERVDAFFEAILDLPRVIDPERAAKVVMAVDEQVRFWPAELTNEVAELAPASRLSTWRDGGFRRASKTAAGLINAAYPIETGALRSALATVPDLEGPDETDAFDLEGDEAEPTEEKAPLDETSALLQDFPLD